MLKCHQFFSYNKSIKVQVGNIEGPSGRSNYVCLALEGGPKARDGLIVLPGIVGTQDSRDHLNLTLHNVTYGLPKHGRIIHIREGVENTQRILMISCLYMHFSGVFFQYSPDPSLD